jgi:hypothetical protein
MHILDLYLIHQAKAHTLLVRIILTLIAPAFRLSLIWWLKRWLRQMVITPLDHL